mgnify:CR=1 FL=1
MADTWRMKSVSNSRAASIILRSAGFSFSGRLETSTLTSTGTNRLAIPIELRRREYQLSGEHRAANAHNRHTEKRDARICRPPQAQHAKRHMNFGN